MLRIGRTTAYSLARVGGIPGCRMIGGVYRVSLRALLEFLEGGGVPGAIPLPAASNPAPARRRTRRQRSVASSKRAKHPHSPE